MLKKSFGMALIILLLALSACQTAQPEAAAEPERVEVTLNEFGVEASTTRFEAGKPYEFVITNEGTIEHEFRILPPAAESEEAGMDMHGGEMHDTALIAVEAAELQPGTTVTVEYTFPDSAAEQDLEIACHTPGHYEAGMLAPITVAN